jgi:large subunit ribosomal protein L28
MGMAMRCMNCDKGVMFGHRVSHAKNRTNRVFKPNLHSARIKVGQMYKTMKLCTKCLRMVKKATTA